jgi:protein-S-isoprenylcysteine O-methyltransferase Ste14
MDRLNTIWTTEMLWLALGVVWIAGRFTGKRVKQRESPVAYLGRVVVIVVLFEILFNPALAIGWLGRRFIPASPALDLTAIGVAAIGVGLAIWARLYLGGNWSGTVTLKEGHELIQRGPYRWIRHPIYTGFDLAFFGTALAIGQWRGLAAFVVIAIAHTMKARKEEAWLAREFGAAFEEHRRRTGMFLPRLVAR